MTIPFTIIPNYFLDNFLNDISRRIEKGGECFSESEAGIWLCRRAAMKQGPFSHAQGVFSVQRGQLVFPYRDGQRFWGWGKTKTEGFLRRLESLRQIQISQLPYTLRANGKPDIKTGVTCLTVCILCEYKSKEKGWRDNFRDTSKPMIRQERDVIKRNNEEQERRKASESLTVKNGGDAISCAQSLQPVLDRVLKSPGPLPYQRPKD